MSEALPYNAMSSLGGGEKTLGQITRCVKVGGEPREGEGMESHRRRAKGEVFALVFVILEGIKSLIFIPCAKKKCEFVF